MNAKLYAACALLLLSPTLSVGQSMCQRFGAGEHSVIEEICAYRGGLAAFKLQSHWGLLDVSGNVVLDPAYEYIQDFSEGLAEVRASEKSGFIDRTGKLVLPMVYDNARSFRDGLAPAQLGDKWGYIDQSGRWVVEPRFADAHAFHQGAALVSEAYGQLQLISRTGALIKVFDGNVDVEGEGFNEAGLALLRIKPPAQRLHLDGRSAVLPKGVDLSGPVRDGVAVASLYDGNERHHGLFDITTGAWRVAPRWAHLDHWNGALAIAGKDEAGESWHGLIDGQGNEVVPAVYRRLERAEESGLYVGARTDGAGWHREVLSAKGVRLAELATPVECNDGGEVSGRLGLVLHGCGSAVLVTVDGHRINLDMTGQPRLSETSQHLLLRFEQEGRDADGMPKGERFALVDRSGNLLLSSEDPAVAGLYHRISLIRGRGEVAKASPGLLPLAVLHGHDGRMAIVTPQGKFVSRPEWIHEAVSDGDDASSEDGKAFDGPLPVRTAYGFGAIDGQGDWVVEPRFERLSEFRHGVAFARKLDRSLLLDARGGMHAIPDDAHGFVQVGPDVVEGENRAGQVVRLDLKKGLPVTLPDTGRSRGVGGDFHHGLAPKEQDERWGLVDEAGEWVVLPRYPSSPEPILAGSDVLGWRVADKTRSPFPTYEGEVAFEELHGVLDAKGAELLPLKYRSVSFDEATRQFAVETDEGSGMMSLQGKVLIEPAHQELKYLGEGWFSAERKELSGLIDARGEWVLPPVPASLDSGWLHGRERGPSYARLTLAGRSVLLDTRGRISSREQPMQAPAETPEHWWSIRERTYGSDARDETVFYGFDWTERLRVHGKVERGFSEGLAVLDDGDTKALIDAKGRKVAFLPYARTGPVTEGKAVVAKELPHLRGNKSNPRGYGGAEQIIRFGYIDRQGRQVIAPRFDDAKEFSESRATVTEKGNLGVIDASGRLLVQGAWLCGRDPILIDGQRRVIWPKGVDPKRKC